MNFNSDSIKQALEIIFSKIQKQNKPCLFFLSLSFKHLGLVLHPQVDFTKRLQDIFNREAK